MKHRKLRIAVVIALVVGAVCAYYLIGRNSYLKAATAAFSQLPVDDCYYLPWPMRPRLIGQLDDPIYLGRDDIEKDSQGMHLSIADSDGTFEITPRGNNPPSAH
jgi:hypothetical protein